MRSFDSPFSCFNCKIVKFRIPMARPLLTDALSSRALLSSRASLLLLMYIDVLEQGCEIVHRNNVKYSHSSLQYGWWSKDIRLPRSIYRDSPSSTNFPSRVQPSLPLPIPQDRRLGRRRTDAGRLLRRSGPRRCAARSRRSARTRCIISHRHGQEDSPLRHTA